ncbi:hypothetical protein TNIN_24931 [Trichonephila inaurata madagascariensis]|uniref:Pre-C2HC domain-containing protein n=1 Tax=Trichonephila inaurata madagascariensis TaxID=2747483 RepID=A0A8X6XIZ3_9ARAC|nr:hypothetical protein TNIN_24931 [Trichonephila inaurata madagascariensis]
MVQNKFFLPVNLTQNIPCHVPPTTNRNRETTSLPTTNNTAPNTTQLPPPVMPKCTDNYRAHVKTLMQVMSTLRTHLTGDFLELYTDNFDILVYRELIHMLENLKYQFYLIQQPKTKRPIKIIFKGLPRNTSVEDIKQDLPEQGFVPEKVTQLIDRKRKQPLPVILKTLPRTRNMENLKIFNIKTLGHLSITVDGIKLLQWEGFQCLQCNNFHHKSENRHLTPLSQMRVNSLYKRLPH